MQTENIHLCIPALGDLPFKSKEGKTLKEDRRLMFLNKIIKFIKNDFPLFKNLKDYGFWEQLSEEELNYVFSEIFGKPVQRKIQSKESDSFWNIKMSVYWSF